MEFSTPHSKFHCLIAGAIVWAVFSHSGVADEFTYRDREGRVVTVRARLVASGQGQHVLELPDGEFRIVPQGAVSKRTPGDPPEPLTPQQVLEDLSGRFGGPERFRGKASGHFVVGLVLDTELSKSAEANVQTCLRQATKFQRTVEKNFLSFTKRMRVRTVAPTHPLVLIIFETDDAFEAYHKEVTGGAGLSSGNVAGFYSPLTNWLVIRMTECLTFETPLHEAIHQQVFNQHVLQRLAPTPAWFNEGIATGFEGNGDQISRGPSKVSVRYAQQASSARRVNWSDLVTDDRAFRGDVFAGEAYTHAWSMHWLLVTKYKKQYAKYVQRIGEDEPLAEPKPAQRRQDIEDIFEKSAKELQSEFPRALTMAVKRQKLPAPEQRRAGQLNVQSNLADVTLRVVSGPRGLGAQGVVRNISLIRPMTFHIVAITNTGEYAEWVIPNLKMNKQVELKLKAAVKKSRGARGGFSRSLRVQVNSAAPGSRDAKLWEAGETPTPVVR